MRIAVFWDYIRNVMLTDEGLPILMDFGSTIPARIEVQTRSQALAQQVRGNVVGF